MLYYVHSTEDEAVFVCVVIANDYVVVKYTHLEDGVVSTDTQV